MFICNLQFTKYRILDHEEEVFQNSYRFVFLYNNHYCYHIVSNFKLIPSIINGWQQCHKNRDQTTFNLKFRCRNQHQVWKWISSSTPTRPLPTSRLSNSLLKAHKDVASSGNKHAGVLTALKCAAAYGQPQLRISPSLRPKLSCIKWRRFNYKFFWK